MSNKEVEDFLVGMGEPKFRAKQVCMLSNYCCVSYIYEYNRNMKVCICMYMVR